MPFLALSLAGLGLNLVTGYAGQIVARLRGVHGGRRLRSLQFQPAPPWLAADRALVSLAGLISGGGRDAIRPAEPAAARLLSGRVDAGGTVLRQVGAHAVRLALELQLVRRHRRAAADPVRSSIRGSARTLSVRADDRRRVDGVGCAPGDDPFGTRIHCRPRQRNRRQGHRRFDFSHQAAGVRFVVVHHRRRRRPVGVRVSAHRGAGRLQSRSLVLRFCSSSSSAAWHRSAAHFSVRR